jgi:hypothetical protein
LWTSIARSESGLAKNYLGGGGEGGAEAVTYAFENNVPECDSQTTVTVYMCGFCFSWRQNRVCLFKSHSSFNFNKHCGFCTHHVAYETRTLLYLMYLEKNHA